MTVKTIASTILASALLVGCAGYAGSTAIGSRPAGIASTSPNAASKEPEPANSLPAGDSVAAPVAPRAGRVGTTRY